MGAHGEERSLPGDDILVPVADKLSKGWHPTNKHL